MKLGKTALAVAMIFGFYAGAADAGQHGIQQVNHCDCGQPACGCEDSCCDDGCDSGCDSCCDEGCDSCCDSGCDGGCDGGCDSSCGGGCSLSGLSGLSCGGCGDCCLGDPCSLFGECCGWTAGGWVQMGYHSRANGLFNSDPRNRFNLHQAWIYAEKALDTSCGFDWGGRVDYMYGVDADDTQAFGTDPVGWDNGWDNGIYGRAMPQLYGEVGYGDTSVKFGHFYTIIGYEVVTAPDNFFFSHAYTMYNSEPFTHTGALATYSPEDCFTFWGGYTLGWDSGFDDNGDAFLGGVSLSATDELTLIYGTTFGRFGEARFNGVEKGYMHSMIADYNVTDSINYVIQHDFLDTVNDNTIPGTTRQRLSYGINQYLFKTFNDCWAVGARFEWWRRGGPGFENERNGVALNPDGIRSVYALTLGVNHRPHANFIVRPEIRWDWDEDPNITAGLQDGRRQTTFGIDGIVTF